MLAVLGGTAVGEDLGYGPARYLDAESVRTLAGALPSPEDFDARFDPHALTAAEIYPDIWDRTDEDHREWINQSYCELLDFYRAAAARGDCVLTGLC